MSEPVFDRDLRRATVWPAIILAVVIALLLALVAFLFRYGDWVEHSDRVLTEAARAEKLAVDMETGVRAFQLTGEAAFLAPWEAATARIGPAFDALAALVADNPAQSQGVAEQRARFAGWRAHADETLARARAGSDVRSLEWNAAGKILFDAFRESATRLAAVENRLRDTQVRRQAHMRTAVAISLAVAALAGVPLLLAAFRRIVQRVGRTYHGALAETAAQRDELHTSLRSIGDAVLATDAAGAIAFLNPVAERLTGWTNEEARDRSLAEVFPIFHQMTGAPAENPVARVLRERVVIGLANHTVLRRRDGTELPIEDSAAPIFHADGTVRGVILVFHDVTEKYAAAEQLRAAEWLARTGLELAGAGAWVWDIRRDIVTGDAFLARAFAVALDRCRAGEPIATFLTAIHEEDRARVQAAVAEAVKSAGDYATEFRVIGEGAVERWLHARGRVEYDATGHFARMPGVLLDITERRQNEAALHRAMVDAEKAQRAAEEGAERLRLLADTVSLQVWTATPDGALDWANQHVVRYFGTNDVEREVLGTAWTQLVHPDDLPAAAARWERAVATGERYETEFRLRNAEGDYRWFLVRAEAMRQADDTVAKWFGANTDIDDLKIAQQTSETANRAKDNFLAALSHELRTPLTPVLMAAAALRDDERLPAEARADLAMIERNIALEARLIDDLLDLTRIAKGKLQLREEACDVHSIIGLAIEIVRDEAMSKPVAIDVELAAKHSGLRGDPARLQQVFWNLLRNAVKFTPTGGRVAIRTRDETNERLRIEVIDTGIGLSPDALETIFRPFEQAGREGDHRFGGLGLGLAIARAIVDLHGGVIRAESAGSGMGATFIVELPNVADQETGVTTPLLHPALQDGTGAEATLAAPIPLRLLLVEDHEPTLAVLKRLLTRSGHGVVTASSVAAAVAAAETAQFDIVISDLGLPDGTGLEVITKLRLLQPHIRGIALSGYGMEDDLHRSVEAGFERHLVKPVDFHQLRRALREGAEHPRTP